MAFSAEPGTYSGNVVIVMKVSVTDGEVSMEPLYDYHFRPLGQGGENMIMAESTNPAGVAFAPAT